MAEVTEGGVVTPQPVFSGSGTIISATGQILTNWHVIDMAEHQSMLESWEVESAANGRPISVKLISDGMLILTSD
ncbi:MAG: serine protease, partial [Chloroflexi bacterium]|nr:serine protease [Chloroflexota bacterium]